MTEREEILRQMRELAERLPATCVDKPLEDPTLAELDHIYKINLTMRVHGNGIVAGIPWPDSFKIEYPKYKKDRHIEAFETWVEEQLCEEPDDYNCDSATPEVAVFYEPCGSGAVGKVRTVSFRKKRIT